MTNDEGEVMKAEDIEINYDRLYEGVEHFNDAAMISDYVRELVEEAFELGRQSVLTEGAARTALLEAQSRWLDEADGASTPTLRTLARVMADAFAQEAARFKTNRAEGFDVDKIIEVVEDDSE
jgi:hypothetical protein